MKNTHSTAEAVQAELTWWADDQVAEQLQRFFQTGPGQYGEGDRFRGIRVPALRKLARKYRHLRVSETEKLLQSPFHEDRLVALLIWVKQFAESEPAFKKRIYRSYLTNTDRINNWNLVDTTAEHIVGAYLADKDKTPLYRLAASSNLWKRRMAMMATFHFIKQGQYEDALKIATVLLNDGHDLIHKAVGWMLREIGKRDPDAEETFLRRHYRQMPRTMLRYAIEKFSETRRRQYLEGRV